MAGIRIQHSKVRDKLMTLVDSSRVYGRPLECAVCHKRHVHKTYHFRLDSVGAAIVSVEIVERIKRLPLQGGFSIGEEIAQPPPQRLIVGGPIQVPEIVEHPTLVEPV